MVPCVFGGRDPEDVDEDEETSEGTGMGAREEDTDILDPDNSTMSSTTTMMTTTLSEDTQAVDDGEDDDPIRDEEVAPSDEGDGSGESVEFDELDAEEEDDTTTDNPTIVFEEDKIVPADEEGSQFGEFSSVAKAREPKSTLPTDESDEKPSSASLLSSLLSSLYEEETQRKTEKSKSKEYVYVNHVSGSKQIYI